MQPSTENSIRDLPGTAGLSSVSDGSEQYNKHVATLPSTITSGGQGHILVFQLSPSILRVPSLSHSQLGF